MGAVRARLVRGWLLVALAGVSCSSAATAQSSRPELSFVRQATVGNIFTSGEAVQLEVGVASGQTVEWSVLDFEGKNVDSGTTAVADQRVRIASRVKAVGYYVAKLVSRAGDQVKGEGVTSFAIVPPADISRMPNSPFAVMTHFCKGMSPAIMTLLAKAGLTSVRDECEWSGFEKQKAQFITPPTVETYMPRLAEAKLEPLMVLAFGNLNHFPVPKVPAYKAAPYDAAGYDAYVRYCQEVLRRFDSQVKTVEIWNEYNGTFCDGPAAQNRPRYYTEMLKRAYGAIKKDWPQVKVVGGALVKIPLPYCEKLFKEGALGYMDAIAVHPYQPTPEGVEKELAELAGLMKRYNGGVAKPIWVTETGSWRDATRDRADNAAYLVRMMTLMLTRPEVERIYWYLACDYREFNTMGILRGEDDPAGRFVPTMVYSAYANLTHRLYGSTFQGRETTDPRTRVYRYDRGSETTLVCWSTSGDTRLTLKTAGPVRLVSIVGGEESLKPEGGMCSVSVSSRPLYLVVPLATSVVETPRPNRIVADSTEDFAPVQGERGWSYHYYLTDAAATAAYDPAGVSEMKWEASRGDWDDQWQGPASYLCLGEGGGQSSARDGKQAWAIRRWTSNYAGALTLSLSVSRAAAQGDGIGCRVFHNGKEILNKLIAPQGSEAVELPLSLAKGDRLDFVLTPGAKTDTSFDAAAFRATLLAALGSAPVE